MAENSWSGDERGGQEESGFDLDSFAEEHDIALGEARQIVREAGCDRTRADKLAHRMKKW